MDEAHANGTVDVTFVRDTTLGGRYLLTDRIAGGGMGEVWAAEDRVLGRSVAVKLLKPELLDEPGFLERFRAEARHTAALAHPGIASIFDYGEDHKVAFLVMELVDGEPLSKLLSRDGSLPRHTALSILAQTSAALDAAHRAGVIHRDVKPGNLLVTADGRVKITDFGISKVVDSVPLTATGQVLGTPQYIAPEQATGSSATAASDIYSLGVIAYEMLVGRRPFIGDTPLALAMAHVHQPMPALPEDVPRELAEVVAAMLAKDPKARPPDAGALAARFRTMQSAKPSSAAPRPPSSSPRPEETAFHTSVQPSASHPATMVAPVPNFPIRVRRKTGRLSPVVIAFALLLLVVVAAVVAASNGDDPTLTDVADSTVAPNTAANTSAPAPLETPTTTLAPTTTVAPFDPNAYLGLNRDDARSQLESLGFEIREQEAKGGGGEKNSVVGVELDPNPVPAGPAGTVTLLVSDGKGKGNGDENDEGD